MAVKKTVKKRRTTKKSKAISIDSIVESLQHNLQLSDVNKRAIDRLKKSVTTVAKQEKFLATHQDRVDKARNAVANARTPAAKDKARIRLGLAQSKLMEVKATLSVDVAEQKKIERLVKGLSKALATVQNRLQRDYDKQAKKLEKAADRPLRRRRTSKKKIATKSTETS